MIISDIRIRCIYDDARLKAFCSVTIGGDFVIHDIKVIQGDKRLFVAMPSRKDFNGNFKDTIHPIASEARRQLVSAILSAYENYIHSIKTAIREEGGK